MNVVNCAGSSNTILLTATIHGIPIDDRLWIIVWYDAATTSVVGTGLTLTVSPSSTKTYSARQEHLSGIELVTDGNFDSPPFAPGSGVTSDLQFTTDDNSIGDGYYGWNQLPGIWHRCYANAPDHNTGVGHKYRIINGPGTPGSRVIEMANIPSVPGKTYAISVYVAPLCGQPQLNFSINGVQLGPTFTTSYDAGISTPPANVRWERFYELFTAASSSGSLAVHNINTEPAGNGVGMDGFSGRAVATATESIQINVVSLSLPDITIQSQPTCALGTGSVLVTSSAGLTGTEYKLDGGAYQSSGTFSAIAPGVHTAMLREPVSGCESPIASFCINPQRLTPVGPILSASAVTICRDGVSVLTADNCNGIVNWSTAEVGQTITSSPTSNGIFTASCTENGCTSPAASVSVTVDPIPSAPTLHTVTFCQGIAFTPTPFGCGGTTSMVNSTTSFSGFPISTTVIPYSMVCSESGCVSLPGTGSVTYPFLPSQWCRP